MGRSGALGSDQLVDPLAQVLQDEVLIGSSLAVVDLLRPLLEREFYAEGLIDGERDVDAIIDDLAGRFEAPRDVIAGDVLPMLQDLVDKRVLRQ